MFVLDFQISFSIDQSASHKHTSAPNESSIRRLPRKQRIRAQGPATLPRVGRRWHSYLMWPGKIHPGRNTPAAEHSRLYANHVASPVRLWKLVQQR